MKKAGNDNKGDEAAGNNENGNFVENVSWSGGTGAHSFCVRLDLYNKDFSRIVNGESLTCERKGVWLGGLFRIKNNNYD